MANEQKNKSIGEVKIAADVVAAIAGLAATEVDGVWQVHLPMNWQECLARKN